MSDKRKDKQGRGAMDRFPELPEGKDSVDRMIQGLRRKDSELNAICTHILIRAHQDKGVNIVPHLVLEAAGTGKRPGHRVRILNVIQRIGGPLTADDFFTLMTLANHHVEEVAQKTVEVVAALRVKQAAGQPVSSD